VNKTCTVSTRVSEVRAPDEPNWHKHVLPLLLRIRVLLQGGVRRRSCPGDPVLLDVQSGFAHFAAFMTNS